MSRTLMIPIHLDALVLETPRAVVEASAAWSRLPYTDGKRDHNPRIAHLSEDIASRPFQNENLYLKAGVHLHWSLPDALTAGVHDGDQLRFPRVPSVWLVTRRKAGRVEHRWIVESDYIHREGEGAGSVAIPWTPDPGAGQHQPFRHLGRRMPLDAWNNRAAVGERAQYWDDLTVIGPGEPLFAAFYPNCHSVFGFHDRQPPDSLAGVVYDVVGWYRDPSADPLARISRELDGSSCARLEALHAELRWTIAGLDEARVEAMPRADFPARTLCYARLSFDEHPTRETGWSTRRRPTVSVGQTGVEALSTYLATRIDSDHQELIARQLAAIELASQLEDLDTQARFEAASHERGFDPRDGGAIWGLESSPHPSEHPPPLALTRLLDALNELQRAYDQGQRRLQSMRQQLLADWYKYMKSAYPPAGQRHDYPDVDELRHFIERKVLAPLTREQHAIGTSSVRTDAGRPSLVLDPESEPGSAAARLAAALDELIIALERHNHHAATSKGTRFHLGRVVQPRFWRPSEPVVLLVGDDFQPSDRFGTDGRGSADGLVRGHLLGMADELHLHLDELDLGLDAALARAEAPGLRRWLAQPSHPLIMEWMVEVFPTRNRRDQRHHDPVYAPEYISSTFDLPVGRPDLTVRPGRGGVVRCANIYRGATVLTPAASEGLADKLEAHIRAHLLPEYWRARQTPEHERSDDVLARNLDAITTWYAEHRNLDSNAARARDLGYTSLRALATIRGTASLSQSLGGFNDALLMRKETFALGVDDPLAFPDYRAFSAERVRAGVGEALDAAGQPGVMFNPIRSGAMELLRLRVVDTFGQVTDVPVDEVVTPREMRVLGSRKLIGLPPRLAQPARLSLRWLPAEPPERLELAAAEVYSVGNPIFGWLVPNLLERSIVIHDRDGRAVGIVAEDGTWRLAPGRAHVELRDRHLCRVVDLLRGRPRPFVHDLVERLDLDLGRIEPDDGSWSDSLAFLVGRPLALARIGVDLEIEGLPATSQDWNTFRQDLRRNHRHDNAFTRVRFPARLGAGRRADDGLVGYWRTDDQGLASGELLDPSRAESVLEVSVSGAELELCVLFDPRARLHAVCGIVPAQSIELPVGYLAEALARLEVTFLTAPVLSPRRKPRIPLPAVAGREWTWMTRHGHAWSRVHDLDTVAEHDFVAELRRSGIDPDAIWDALLQQDIGWLRGTAGDPAGDPGQARVALASQRAAASLPGPLAGLDPWIAGVLEPRLGRDVDRPTFIAALRAAGLDPQAIWTALCGPDGWLMPVEHDGERQVRIRPRELRGTRTLEAFAGLEARLEDTLERARDRISPLDLEALAGGGELELIEGWLSLGRNTNDETRQT